MDEHVGGARESGVCHVKGVFVWGGVLPRGAVKK